MEKIIIGVVGLPLSGKDAFANHLVRKYGFEHLSTGDVLRMYISAFGMGPCTREKMQKVARTLRKEKGADFLLESIKEINGQKVVVTGLRSVAEIDYLKNLGGLVVACISPVEKRFKRARRRKRESDLLSFSEFSKHEEKELYSESEHGQNLGKVFEMADFKIENSGSLKSFKVKVDEFIQALGLLM